MNLKTRIRSAAMRRFSSAEHLEKQRVKARKRREKQGEPATVHYFHQVDDPYSHLVIQKLDQLTSQYTLPFQPHLVSHPDSAYQGSEAHFDAWARRDAANIAADYGTVFAPTVETPDDSQVAVAHHILADHLNQPDFVQTALQVGEAIWTNQALETTNPTSAGAQALEEGNALRRSYGHYQGGMFYFDGEWFWGLDRVRLLEERLIDEGYGKRADSLCVPEPTPTDTTGLNANTVLLEYFPSLRSPYTAIGHQRVLDLIARSGVQVEVRPVMPMMMRGIPAPREKQRYIITDAGREGRAHNTPFGKIVDPFGEPVKQAFALFPACAALGRGMEFVTAYLDAAWFQGIDITKESGLKQVAANARLDWQALKASSEELNWEAMLDDNLSAMLQENLWGVPSFRVSGGNSQTAYACWGQDRIWRVETEIARRV